MVALAARREIDVVGEPKPGESVLDAVARTQADVIVVELDQSRLSPCVRSYLDSAAPLRVVTLTDDARQGAYYDLHATPIENVSGESLLAAVEGAS